VSTVCARYDMMHREGFDIARCTVARLMKDIGIEIVIRGKKPRTTVPDKALRCQLDHVNRWFHAPAPNVLWVSDFTYVATWQGFVYVAFVIDDFARRIVGWHVQMQVLSWMLLSKPFINAGRHRIRWCITRIAALQLICTTQST